MKKRQRIFGVLLAILMVIVIFFSTIINFIVDYQWFTDLGYTDTFLVKVITYAKLGLPLWLITATAFAIYFLWVEKQYFRLVHVLVDVKKRENKLFKRALITIATLVTFLMSLGVTGALWFDILKFQHATSFDKIDPLFSKDISFYVFQLPLYNKLLGIGVFYIVILAIATVLINLILMGLKPPTDLDFSDFQNVRTIGDMSGLARKGIIQSLIIKLGVFGFLVFLLLIAYFWLARYNLVFSPQGVAYGASYTDIHVVLPSLVLQIGAAGIGAAVFIYALLKRQYRLMLTGPVLIIAINVLFGIGGVFVQNFIVEPDEISKERPYLEYNIAFTREAFKLNDISEMDYQVETSLTEDMLTENRDVIDNIRINDYRPLMQTYNQIQGIRLYYRFNDIDTDRYLLNGKYTQVLLSAREMDTEKLQVQTWQNRHIKFTHGYGAALSPVNSVTPEGLPKLLIKNIPPESETALEIKQPEIYFGETTNDYIIVNTSEKEFDYPKGSDNQETMYQGDSGIKMSFWNRALFAIYNGDFRIMVSNIISSESRMIMKRSVSERLQTLAPFMTFDGDPYLVIDDQSGKLFWIIDAYTHSTEYPYSQPYDNTGTNYLRNSVKAVVDAYTGDVSLYMFDEMDPMLKTYHAIFPNLFKPAAEFPEALKGHVRYPRTMLQIQGEVYRKYHVTNPSVFYNGEDIWDVGSELYMDATEVHPIAPDYALYKIPGEKTPEFLLTQPFTPKDKPNMTSLFIARNDGVNYGKLTLLKFPKNKTTMGPAMLESKIDQDSIISPQLSLWSQKGSRVLRGNILIIPINGNLLYVEPIYLQAENQESLPEMKQVVVSYNDKVVMAQTLDQGLAQLFGAGYNRDDLKEDILEGTGDQKLEKLLDDALDRFNRTQTELQELQKVLEQLQKEIDAQNGKITPPVEGQTTTEPTTTVAPTNP